MSTHLANLPLEHRQSMMWQDVERAALEGVPLLQVVEARGAAVENEEDAFSNEADLLFWLTIGNPYLITTPGHGRRDFSGATSSGELLHIEVDDRKLAERTGYEATVLKLGEGVRRECRVIDVETHPFGSTYDVTLLVNDQGMEAELRYRTNSLSDARMRREDGYEVRYSRRLVKALYTAMKHIRETYGQDAELFRKDVSASAQAAMSGTVNM